MFKQIVSGVVVYKRTAEFIYTWLPVEQCRPFMSTLNKLRRDLTLISRHSPIDQNRTHPCEQFSSLKNQDV